MTSLPAHTVPLIINHCKLAPVLRIRAIRILFFEQPLWGRLQDTACWDHTCPILVSYGPLRCLLLFLLDITPHLFPHGQSEGEAGHQQLYWSQPLYVWPGVSLLPRLLDMLGFDQEIRAEHVQAMFCHYSKDVGFLKLDLATFLEKIMQD